MIARCMEEHGSNAKFDFDNVQYHHIGYLFAHNRPYGWQGQEPLFKPFARSPSTLILIPVGPLHIFHLLLDILTLYMM